MTNADLLRQLMQHHGLTRRAVAHLLGKRLNSARGQSNSSVDAWLSGRNAMPDTPLELLRLKLKR